MIVAGRPRFNLDGSQADQVITAEEQARAIEVARQINEAVDGF